MGHRKRSMVVSVTLVLILICSVSPALPSSAQGEQLELLTTTYYIIQGENGLIQGEGSAKEFTFLEILSFRLPHDVGRVYASVPPDAHNVTAWVASKGLINSTFGREISGPMAGELFVDVPSWFERGAVVTNSTNNSQSFLAQGSSMTNVTYDSGSLHLLANYTEGTYTSAAIPVPENAGISSANLTLYGTDLGNVAIEISNDNGSTWTQAVPGSDTAMTSVVTSGAVFLVKLIMRGNETSPQVTGLTAAVRYLLPSTTFTVHITYAWAGEFVDGDLALDLTEPVPYQSGGSSFVFLYVLKGYSLAGTGIALSLDEDGDPSEPDKDFYVNMTLEMSGSVSRSILITEPERNLTWLFGLAVGVAAVGGAGYVLWRRRPTETQAMDEMADDESPDPSEPGEDLAKRKSELIARKAKIAARLESLSTAKATGSASVAEASEELESLKVEFKKVRNELNHMSRKIAASQKNAAPGSPDDSYDSLLASIARLDEDHEKGRLPEKTYQSLRKQYKSRAAELLAARSTTAAESPLENEKTKLMEAIVALEEERERGEIDEKVFAELQTSYRRELADVLRQLEESEEE